MSRDIAIVRTKNENEDQYIEAFRDTGLLIT